MGNNELTTYQKKELRVKATMSQFLNSPNTQQYLDNVLAEKKSSFVANLTTIVNNDWKLRNCDKQTILSAAIYATSIGLPIDPALGRAYVIPYGDEAQLQIGTKGWKTLAINTNRYKEISEREVREGEFAGRTKGGEPIIKWLEDEDERETRKVIGYSAYFLMLNGYEKCIYWTMDKIKAHAKKYSQGYRKFLKDGASTSTAKSGNMVSPWQDSFDQMALKTITKELICKNGAVSIEDSTMIARAMEADQGVIRIDDSGSEHIEFVDNPTVAESTSLSKRNQELLLKSYAPEILQEALYAEELQDITELSDSDMDTFIGTCEKIKKDNQSVSGEKQIELK